MNSAFFDLAAGSKIGSKIASDSKIGKSVRSTVQVFGKLKEFRLFRSYSRL